MGATIQGLCLKGFGCRALYKVCREPPVRALSLGLMICLG